MAMQIQSLQVNLIKSENERQKLDEQISDLRDINHQANKDLKLAIESVKQAKEMEEGFNGLQTQNHNLKLELQRLTIQLEQAKVVSSKAIDEEKLRAEFKETLEEIKHKYEIALEKSAQETQELAEKLEGLSRQVEEPVVTHQHRDLERENRRELARLLDENCTLKNERDSMEEEIEELKSRIDVLSQREVREIRKLKNELEDKNESIQRLIAQIEAVESDDDGREDTLVAEVDIWKREAEVKEDRLKKVNAQLRMVYTKINYMIKRITGRSLLDDSMLKSLLITFILYSESSIHLVFL